MPITVNVGDILECDQNDEIRTRGCDPCVGLIVIYNNGSGKVVKRCAHFSVGFAGPYTQANINARLNPILDNYFPQVNILAVGFTWGGGGAGMGSAFIYNRLTEYFAAVAPVQSETNDSITTNGNNIQILNGEVWPYDPQHNNQAEL